MTCRPRFGKRRAFGRPTHTADAWSSGLCRTCSFSDRRPISRRSRWPFYSSVVAFNNSGGSGRCQLALADVVLHRTSTAARDRRDPHVGRPHRTHRAHLTLHRVTRRQGRPDDTFRDASADAGVARDGGIDHAGGGREVDRGTRDSFAADSRAYLRRGDAATELSESPDGGEPRRSSYISQPWATPEEFRPPGAA